MESRVFVSYSRGDRQIVEPLVKLLRLRGDMVFFDIDTITPGQLWRDELESAIASASWFVLFWCSHSSTSREVEREFRAALSLKKRVVPLILDDTALPEAVAAFQGIDFRSIPGLHPNSCASTGDPFVALAPLEESAHPSPKRSNDTHQHTPPQPLTAVFGSKGGTIGRSEDCTLHLADPDREISRVQANVACIGGGFTIQNVGAADVLHGDLLLPRYASAAIRDGDLLRIGPYQLSATIDPRMPQMLGMRASRGEAPIPDDWWRSAVTPSHEPEPNANGDFSSLPSQAMKGASLGDLPLPSRMADALQTAADRLLAALGAPE